MKCSVVSLGVVLASGPSVFAMLTAGVTIGIDGQPRPLVGGYDLGADEFWSRIYLPIVLRNYQ